VQKKGIIAASAGCGGLAGYIIGRLTSADLRSILERIIDGLFAFLRSQGPYIAYALVMAVGFGGFCVWAIRQLVKGKEAEIDRLVTERDRFQMLFIEEWQTSRKKGK
jgi:hypothetical protein